MRTGNFRVLAALSLWAALGCGKGTMGLPNGSVRPLEGHRPSRASEIAGSWLAEGKGDFQGLQFLDDGKAAVVPTSASLLEEQVAGVQMSYRLEGPGVIALAPPGEHARIFEIALQGECLELRGEMPASRVLSQRFRRLAAGRSLHEVIQAKRRDNAEKREAQAAALEAFLGKPGLVFSCGDTAGTPPIAVEFTRFGRASFEGRAWHDDKPPHLDVIEGQFLFDNQGGPGRLQFLFGKRIAPPSTEGPDQDPATLEVEGDPKNPRISGQIPSDTQGKLVDVVLKCDPALHGEIVARFEAEMARLEALKRPLLEALNEVVVLGLRSASITPAGDAPGDPLERMVLHRAGKRGLWAGEGSSKDSRTAAAENRVKISAGVEVVNGVPELHIAVGRSWLYRLTLAGDHPNVLQGSCFQLGIKEGRPVEWAILESSAAGDHARPAEQRR